MSYTVAVDSCRSKHLVTHLNCVMRNLYNSTQLHTKTYTMSVYKEKRRLFVIYNYNNKSRSMTHNDLKNKDIWYIQPFLVNEFFTLIYNLTHIATLRADEWVPLHSPAPRGSTPTPRHAYALVI